MKSLIEKKPYWLNATIEKTEKCMQYVHHSGELVGGKGVGGDDVMQSSGVEAYGRLRLTVIFS